MSDEAVSRLNAALSGQYRIERELGEGGMASVYLAGDLRHERKVALKVLRPELAAVVGAERFLAEIKTTANLSHPHILPLHDSGEADGFLFYVMPFVEGETLRDRLRRERQLAVEDAVGIARNVAEGLAYAHARGVIHRDVKPANILLQAGKPVISDFGIALAVSAGGGTRLTETGLSLGTPHYMSPEQATGDQTVGPPSDVYSLGCVLYEMLVGEPPYRGGTAQAILGKIITGRADPVTEHRAAVPPNVDAAIRRSLEKVPADRFGTAEDFAAALRDAGYRYGTSTAEAVADAGRWRGIAVAMGALALIAAAALTWTLATRDTAPPPAVANLSIVLPEGDRLNLRNDGGLAVAPDGRSVVYGATRDGVDQLFHRTFDGEIRPIPNTDRATGPFFSPDGASVGFFVDGTLQRLELAGGVPRPLWELGLQHGGTWGPDGYIYFGQHESGLSKIPEDGGTPAAVTEVTATSVRDHHGPVVLPGARAILFQAETLDAGTNFVEVQNLVTGARNRLARGTDPTYVEGGYLVFNRTGTLMAVRFDAERLESVGEEFSLVDGVATGPWGGAAEYAFAGGTLVYARGATGGSSLVHVDRQGALVASLGADGALSLPRIAPDGSRVAYIDREEIWVLDLERRIPTRVPPALTQQLVPFAWLPDSRSVAFSLQNDLTAVHVVSVDGPGASRLLFGGDGTQYPTSWSPTGELALYRTGLGTSRDVLVRDTINQTETVVAGTESNEMGGVFSPDGGHIAYVSDETGRNEVYVQPFPGPGRRDPVSGGGGTEPAWSTDGRELFYRIGPDMMVVDVIHEPVFGLGAPRLLFTNGDYDLNPSSGPGTAWYDVLPGTEGFVMLRGTGQPGSEIVVVLNFVELLRERVR